MWAQTNANNKTGVSMRVIMKTNKVGKGRYRPINITFEATPDTNIDKLQELLKAQLPADDEAGYELRWFPSLEDLAVRLAKNGSKPIEINVMLVKKGWMSQSAILSSRFAEPAPPVAVSPVRTSAVEVDTTSPEFLKRAKVLYDAAPKVGMPAGVSPVAVTQAAAPPPPPHADEAVSPLQRLREKHKARKPRKLADLAAEEKRIAAEEAEAAEAQAYRDSVKGLAPGEKGGVLERTTASMQAIKYLAQQKASRQRPATADVHGRGSRELARAARPDPLMALDAHHAALGAVPLHVSPIKKSNGQAPLGSSALMAAALEDGDRDRELGQWPPRRPLTASTASSGRAARPASAARSHGGGHGRGVLPRAAGTAAAPDFGMLPVDPSLSGSGVVARAHERADAVAGNGSIPISIAGELARHRRYGSVADLREAARREAGSRPVTATGRNSYPDGSGQLSPLPKGLGSGW